MPFASVGKYDVYYERTARDDSAEKTSPYTLVFVHGMGGAVETWTAIRAYLLKYSCVYIDLPGHGRSEGEALTVVDNATTVVKTVQSVVPKERFVFIGISYGSAVAMKIAALYPSLTAGLVLMSPRAHFNISGDTLQQLVSSVEDGSFVTKGAGTKTSPTMVEGMQRGMARTSPATIRELFGKYNGFDIRQDLANFRVPALVLSGLEDGISDLDDARLIHKEIRSSRLVELPCGHFIPIESPRQVVTELKDFMAKLS